MTTDLFVETEIGDGVMNIVLNRPKANALNSKMLIQLQAAFQEAGRNTQVRCVLLSASGNTFCAGQDLTEMQLKADISYLAHLQSAYNPLIMLIRSLEKPVLAAVQGTVAGAGLGLVLACDLRIAGQEAQFKVGFSGIGLATDSAVSLLLPLLIGIGRASEAAFLNSPIPADQALIWGLVNRVVPKTELHIHAREWAKQLAQGPVHAYGLTKRDFNKAILPNLAAVLEYEAQNQEIARKYAEHAEGLRAFEEKRSPNFRQI